MGETPQDRSSQEDSLCTQSKGLEHISSFPDASVQVNFHIPTLDSLQNLGQSIDLCVSVRKYVTAMVRITDTRAERAFRGEGGGKGTNWYIP